MSDALCRAVWLAYHHIGDKKYTKTVHNNGVRSPAIGQNTYKSYHLRKMRRNIYQRQRKTF